MLPNRQADLSSDREGYYNRAMREIPPEDVGAEWRTPNLFLYYASGLMHKPRYMAGLRASAGRFMEHVRR